MTKTVLVVGGAGGICSEAVRQILEQGYDVVATVPKEAQSCRNASDQAPTSPRAPVPRQRVRSSTPQ